MFFTILVMCFIREVTLLLELIMRCMFKLNCRSITSGEVLIKGVITLLTTP